MNARHLRVLAGLITGLFFRGTLQAAASQQSDLNASAVRGSVVVEMDGVEVIWIGPPLEMSVS